MNHAEIQHRDSVLRNYFKGRNWDKNNEHALKRKLVCDSHQLISDYPYVVEDEWEVVPSQTDKGCGDLVFTDGNGNFAVIEVKWIDRGSTHRTGRTKRTSNRQKRRTVEKQALRYSSCYQERRNTEAAIQVAAFVFTNENELPQRIT